jgi:hypothetical protein
VAISSPGQPGTAQARKLGLKAGLRVALDAAPDGWALSPPPAGHVSDITDNVVRSAVLELGLVDVKVAAVDEDWSGLRLVWPVARRRDAGPRH